MIVVPTIPHTGTHFMRDHLLAGHEIYCRHFYENELAKIMELMREHPAIIPMRKKAAVARSWERYGKDLDDFGGWSLEQWFTVLDKVLMPFEPYILNIDKPGVRDEQLARINEELGLELVTDWPILRQPCPSS